MPMRMTMTTRTVRLHFVANGDANGSNEGTAVSAPTTSAVSELVAAARTTEAK